MKRLAILLISLLLLGVLLSACAVQTAPQVIEKTVVVTMEVEKTVVVTATPEPAPAPKQGGKLIAARAADAKGLDPHKQTAFSSFRLLELIYEPLLGLNDKLEVVPNLADSWTWSDGGQTLTMKLHPGVKFHNGDIMTSEDVKFSFERILNEDTGSAARSYFTDIQEIETPDEETVVFKLSRPNVAILAAMTNPNSAILDKKVVESEDPSKVVVGTGPFKLNTWDVDQVTILDANKDYWRAGVPHLDQIEIRIIPDEMSILAGLRAGTIDWALINDPKTAILASSAASNLKVDRTPALAYHVLQLNSGRAPLDDVRVRQAISCAIDRQEVIDTAALGEGKVTAPATSPFYSAPLDELFCYKKDVEKAKQLLAEAGYPDGGISFKIMAAADEPPTAVAEAQSIQAQLKEIGIETEIETLELGVYVDRWLHTDFDSVVALNGGNPDPDIMFYRYWHSTGNLHKVAVYTNPEIDKLLDAAKVALDPEERRADYLQVQKILAEEAPWIWLYVGFEYRVMQPYVKDFTPMPNGSIKYLRDVWLDK
ncbi:MAG: ABC transporter substrate-binding protein [Chloroflexi bacterium]|nr:ABC transporter substrate-binding protein [Chloroflexota bacterium]